MREPQGRPPTQPNPVQLPPAPPARVVGRSRPVAAHHGAKQAERERDEHPDEQHNHDGAKRHRRQRLQPGGRPASESGIRCGEALRPGSGMPACWTAHHVRVSATGGAWAHTASATLWPAFCVGCLAPTGLRSSRALPGTRLQHRRAAAGPWQAVSAAHTLEMAAPTREFWRAHSRAATAAAARPPPGRRWQWC